MTAMSTDECPLPIVSKADDNPHMENPVHEKLKGIIAERNLNWEQASQRCGLDRSYFRTLFSRDDAVPRGKTLKKIADGLGVPIADILEGGDDTPKFRPLPAKSIDLSTVPFLEAPRVLANDIPVLGTAAGSHLKGAFQISSDPIDYARRPPALVGATGIYGLYVEGESMIPQYSPGELLIINPNKPPRPGDAVIVQARVGEHQPIEATLGIYVKRSTDIVTIHKHNPSADIDLMRRTVVDVHRVLTMAELFGL